jgi:hypothetical protein
MFDVAIDFDQSHWFFPKIIIISLIIVGFIVAFLNRKAISENVKNFNINKVINKDNSLSYVFLIMIAIYILAMDFLSDVFPNTGYAFLIATMPMMFLTSLFFVEEISKKKLLIIAANSTISPVVAWVLLGQVFAISLP